MCKTTTPTQMPISASPMVNAPGAPGAADLQSLFGDNATKDQQSQATVNKPTKFGRALELGTLGAYDPTGGEDTTNEGKTTKFGALLNVVRPMVTGAVIGGLTGRSTPGGGFAGANQFFLNQRMRQMQMSEFLLNQMKMQSEITKNAAEAQWAQRRPLLTRTANTIKGKDAQGNDVFESQNPNTGEWEAVPGVTPESQQPDYATVPTNQGIVKYDKRGIGQTVPLSMGQSSGSGSNADLAAEAGGMSSSGGTPSASGSLPASGFRKPGSAMPSPGNVPLMPPTFGKPKPAAVTNRDASGAETTNLIDEDPDSPTFGQTLKKGVSNKAPLPNKTEQNTNDKNAASASVESYAQQAMKAAGNDPDKALQILQNAAGKITDKNTAAKYMGMMPQIRSRIREMAKPGKTGKKSRLTPDEAKQLGLQATGQASMTGEDEDQQ